MDIKTKLSKEQFVEYANQTAPKSKTFVECVKAFIVGGAICVFGELLTVWFESMNFSQDEAGIIRTILLIFLGAFFTGVGLYNKLGKFAGAGSIVPITGFANSMVSPAIEYRCEGLSTGLGAKLFTVAGPVLVFGISASIVYGIILCIFGV